jgi:RNA polymerase primary sigma factor
MEVPVLSSTEKTYLDRISHLPSLTLADERALTERILQGDESARREMITANLKLVASIAREYSDSGVSFMDLVQEGNIGLMKAVERYELGHGAKFSTYAKYWIKLSMRTLLRSQARVVKVTAYVAEWIYKLRRTSNSLTASLSRPPSVAELAEAVGLPVDRVEKYLSLSKTPIRLDEPVESEEGDYSNTTRPGLVDESLVDVGEHSTQESVTKCCGNWSVI